MTRLVVGPFNRVEGDLEVRLDVSGGIVHRAEVVSPLFRGFETILAGKAPSDALVFVPRICGICSVSQSVAAARAIGAAQGLSLSGNGALAVNIVHAVENIADHLTHFYLFFMPDFTREFYAGRDWHDGAVHRFLPIKGTASADMLPARAEFLNMLGTLAGKWPHTLFVRPGGSTRSVTGGEQARLFGLALAFRRFLERHLFGDRLEAVAGLASEGELSAWRRRHGPSRSDFGMFLAIADDTGLRDLGRAYDRFLSVGAYASEHGHLFAPGSAAEAIAPFDPALVTEDADHAWYQPGHGRRAPFEGVTAPRHDVEKAYSWCKAPRYGGKPFEVGALARQVVARNQLALDMVAAHGGNVFSRVVARLQEIALTMIALERWIGMIDPGQAFLKPDRDPEEGQGIGLTEAARGSLGHWMSVKNGRIANYQIIAPTTWNFSPRDDDGVPGPLEAALAGLPVEGGQAVNIQHVVRSFDPCMVCTVH